VGSVRTANGAGPGRAASDGGAYRESDEPRLIPRGSVAALRGVGRKLSRFSPTAGSTSYVSSTVLKGVRHSEAGVGPGVLACDTRSAARCSKPGAGLRALAREPPTDGFSPAVSRRGRWRRGDEKATRHGGGGTPSPGYGLVARTPTAIGPAGLRAAFQRNGLTVLCTKGVHTAEVTRTAGCTRSA